MLRPIIMIGCGGSGQKAVRYVRDSVKRHLEHQGWEGDFPKAWQFLGIDTLTTQEDPSIPFLPNNDYVSVSLRVSLHCKKTLQSVCLLHFRNVRRVGQS